MRGGERYKARGAEAESEPGSRGRVLRNLAGIRSVREMARRESEALLTATERLIDDTTVEQRFTAEDICRMHRIWLGEIYSWAGQYRQVNMKKDGFPFAAANQVPRLMRELERGALRQFTPCRSDDADEQAQALGIVHAELVLIHPVSRGKRALRASPGNAYGFAGEIAGARFRRDPRGGEATLYRRYPGSDGP